MFLAIGFVLNVTEFDDAAVSRAPDMQAVVIAIARADEDLAGVFDQTANGGENSAKDNRAVMFCGGKAGAK